MQKSRNEERRWKYTSSAFFGVQKLSLDKIDSFFFQHLFQKLIGVLSFYNAERTMGEQGDLFRDPMFCQGDVVQCVAGVIKKGNGDFA